MHNSPNVLLVFVVLSPGTDGRGLDPSINQATSTSCVSITLLNTIIHPYITPSIHSSINPSIHFSFHSLIHQCIKQSIQLSIHSLINESTSQSVNQCIPNTNAFTNHLLVSSGHFFTFVEICLCFHNNKVVKPI